MQRSGGRKQTAIMRRLVPFLVTAMMAIFPPSSLQVLIGGLSSTSGPSSSFTNHGVCVAGTGDVVAPSLEFPCASVDAGGRGTGFVPGVAHAAQTATHHSHYSMVATTASIATSAMISSPGGSGGKNSVLKSVSAELLGSGSRGSSGGGVAVGNMPRQLLPVPGQEGSQHLRQAPLHDGKATASSLGAGRENFVAEAPPDTLKVSVLGASRGKSSSCAFSLVEFSNTVSRSFKVDIQLDENGASDCLALFYTAFESLDCDLLIFNAKKGNIHMREEWVTPSMCPLSHLFIFSS